jgi:hypothetical protein
MDTTVSSDASKPELCPECTDAGCANAESLPGYMTAAGTGGVEYECQRADAYSDAVGNAGTGHGSYEYRSGC